MTTEKLPKNAIAKMERVRAGNVSTCFVHNGQLLHYASYLCMGNVLFV